MKILLFLILVFFSGCTSTENSLHKTITRSVDRAKIIVRQDRFELIRDRFQFFGNNLLPYKEKQYELLSVRGDSALVVLDWEEREVEPLPFSHAIVLSKDPFTKIIGYDRDHPVENGIKGALFGGLALGVAAVGLGYIPFLDISATSSTYTHSTYYLIIAVSTFAGVAIGGIAGATAYRKELSLSFSEDRKFLRSISLYPDKEPDAMQYIK